MKPGLAAVLVGLFTRVGDTILDPFSGSGTIPFEACRQGRRGIACDLSPLAQCISAAKVTPPTPNEANDLVGELERRLSKGRGPSTALGETEIENFYDPETWREILVAREFFAQAEAATDLHPAHWLVKASVAHILHGNRPYALSRRSHGIIPIPPKGPTVYKSLIASLREKVTRAKLDTLGPDFVRGHSYRASCFELPLHNGEADAVITSPPFLGTTEFLRQNRLRLWFCGWDYQRQAAEKSSGAFLEYHKTLNAYAQLLVEVKRVLKPSGLAMLHLGVVGKHDMGVGVEDLAEKAGFDTEGLLYEDTRGLESHGRTARGATHTHQFLFLHAPK